MVHSVDSQVSAASAYQTVLVVRPQTPRLASYPHPALAAETRAAGSDLHSSFVPSHTSMDNVASGSAVKKQEEMDVNDPKIANKDTKPPVRTLNRVPRTIHFVHPKSPFDMFIIPQVLA